MVIQGHGVGSGATAVEKIFWSLDFFRKERSVSGKKEEQILSLPSLRQYRIPPGSQRRGNELDQIWIQSGFVISKLANYDVVAPYLIITVQWNIQQVTVIILGPRKRENLLKKKHHYWICLVLKWLKKIFVIRRYCNPSKTILEWYLLINVASKSPDPKIFDEADAELRPHLLFNHFLCPWMTPIGLGK